MLNKTLSRKNINTFRLNEISDSAENKSGKSKSQKPNIGGIFISPAIGISFPLSKFADYSTSGFYYGFKAEVAFNKVYPFVFGFVYENQRNSGNAEFTTSNFLTKYDTRIISLGGSMDIVLNKFVKTDFTTPIFTVEVKYSSVKKEVEPVSSNPDIPGETNVLTYTAGLGFTIYVLDLFAKYNFAGDYSNLNFSARIHIPVIKF